MGEINAPDIVFSCAGHDKGEAFVVIKTMGDRAFLVNGKTRKLKNPKAKSLKHVRFGKTAGKELKAALGRGEDCDRLIRKELAIFRGEVGC